MEPKMLAEYTDRELVQLYNDLREKMIDLYSEDMDDEDALREMASVRLDEIAVNIELHERGL